MDRAQKYLNNIRFKNIVVINMMLYLKKELKKHYKEG